MHFTIVGDWNQETSNSTNFQQACMNK